MCSKPKNPQRKPKPKCLRSFQSHKLSEASFNCSLSMQSRSSSKSSVTTGKIPANTIGFTSSKPLIISPGLHCQCNGIANFYFFCIFYSGYNVSNIACTYFTSLVANPILKYPLHQHHIPAPVETNFILSPFFNDAIKNSEISNNAAETVENTDQISKPAKAHLHCLLAQECVQQWLPKLLRHQFRFSACQQNFIFFTPIKSMIWSFTSAIIAPSISILLMTGIISRSLSIAKYKLLMVCA